MKLCIDTKERSFYRSTTSDKSVAVQIIHLYETSLLTYYGRKIISTPRKMFLSLIKIKVFPEINF